MEESLKSWVEHVCRDLLGISDADCNLFDDNLFTLGKYLFQLPNASFEELHNTGADVLNLRKDDTSLCATATILLKFAVSSECKHKGKFVSHIISMDSDIQENLMFAIQDQSLVLADDSDSDGMEDESFVSETDVNNLGQEEEDDEQNISKEIEDQLHSPSRRNNDSNTVSSSVCDNCYKMEKDLSNYAQQINHLLDRERILEEKLKLENIAFLNNSMDLQDIITGKDQFIKDQALQIENYLENEGKYLERLQNLEIITEKVSQLQDEVDMLHPYVKRCETAESQLARMREKLDKLDGVKDQLRAQVESHNTTQAELLKLTVEVDSLRKLKTQIVEYRDRCAENSITIGDLTCQLTSSQEEVKFLMLKLKEVNDGRQVTESYSQSLVDELRVASEALRNSERECGIGGGISELNPEISKELNRLRVENEDLLNKINLSSLESLDKLQQSLSDQECINNSLQQKWTKSKETIETLSKNIVGLETTLSGWIEKYANLTKLFDESMIMAAQDRVSLAMEFDKKLAKCIQRSEHSNYILSEGLRAVVMELQQEYNTTYASLTKAESSLLTMTDRKNSLEGALQQTEMKLEEESMKRKREADDFCKEKLEYESICEKEKLKLIGLHESNTKELTQKYKLQLDTEKSKNLNLAADIEEEKLKRRKLDREKRFHESECHRYKSQLQMSSNSNDNNVEVESALKEMKAMQEQLDAARNQISHLQSLTLFSDQEKDISFDSKKLSTAGSSRRALGSNALRVNQRSDTLSTYVEQTEMFERKIEFMTRERREMIAKNLEENKERMELNQKLLQCEKEVTAYKSKVTKLTLEKERLERRLAKQNDQENIAHLSVGNRL